MSARLVASASLVSGEVRAWVDPDFGGLTAALSLAAAVVAGRGTENDSNGETS